MENTHQATIIGILTMGVFATLVIDVWAYLVKVVLRLPTSNWALIGRWFGHLPRGVFIHHPIGTSKHVAKEGLIGWVAHYVIGILYAFGYLFIVVTVLDKTPSLTSAVVFGLVTLVAPWFLLQPGLGLGVFASRVPRSGAARLVTLSVHAIFGASLFLGWWLCQQYLL